MFFVGGLKGSRTPDLCNANAALYQLSYQPINIPGSYIPISLIVSRETITFYTVTNCAITRSSITVPTSYAPGYAIKILKAAIPAFLTRIYLMSNTYQQHLSATLLYVFPGHPYYKNYLSLTYFTSPGVPRWNRTTI